MKSFFSAVLVTCFLLTSCASSGKHELTQEERVEVLVQSAASGLNEGDSTGALINLKEAEALNPQMSEIQYLLALCYYQKHEIGLATRSARKAILLNPNFSAAKNTLGKLLLDQGNFVEAEKYLTEAQSDLTYREAYLSKTNLGLLNYKKMKYAESERWFSKAILEAGDGACLAFYYRGQLFYDKGNFDKANQDFSRATKRFCSQFSDAHLAVGKTFLRLKKYDQARAKLLEVQQLFPTSDAATKANDYLREIP